MNPCLAWSSSLCSTHSCTIQAVIDSFDVVVRAGNTRDELLQDGDDAEGASAGLDSNLQSITPSGKRRLEDVPCGRLTQINNKGGLWNYKRNTRNGFQHSNNDWTGSLYFDFDVRVA